MSKWLASVQSVEEAQILLPVLPDILDMKNPALGALGALSVDTVTKIVRLIERQCLTSATIGDLPMQSENIALAMMKMAKSGVDYIKIGLFPDENLTQCIRDLECAVKSLGVPVIAVLFADDMPDIDCIPLLKKTGFHGVMVDTAIKNGQGLLKHWDLVQLKSFVETVQKDKFLCGLAGALRIEDIALLKSLHADYLGFRSALCQQRQRTNQLQIDLAVKIQQAVYS